jgi:5-methylcytosine-specific restriction endonuclease McrA
VRLCSGAGCGRSIPDDVRYCAECAPEHATQLDTGIRENVPASQADRDLYRRIYGSRRWKTIRREALQAHPFCGWPGCHAVSKVVDHAVPMGEAIRQCQASGRWPYDPDAGAFLLSNLMGMCRSHHGTKTDEDKRHVGPWPDVLAAYDAAPRKVWAF